MTGPDMITLCHSTMFAARGSWCFVKLCNWTLPSTVNSTHITQHTSSHQGSQVGNGGNTALGDWLEKLLSNLLLLVWFRRLQLLHHRASRKGHDLWPNGSSVFASHPIQCWLIPWSISFRCPIWYICLARSWELCPETLRALEACRQRRTHPSFCLFQPVFGTLSVSKYLKVKNRLSKRNTS